MEFIEDLETLEEMFEKHRLVVSYLTVIRSVKKKIL